MPLWDEVPPGGGAGLHRPMLDTLMQAGSETIEVIVYWMDAISLLFRGQSLKGFLMGRIEQDGCRDSDGQS